MEYSYPLLKKVFEHYNSAPHEVGDTFLLACQHFLEPQKRMIEYLIEFGFKPENILMLGKAYSTNGEILEELKTEGVRTVQPEFSGALFDDEHDKNCRDLIAQVPSESKIILLDDGAHLIKSFIASGRPAIFGVEQTSSGFRRLENISIPFPVLNVARSATKLTQESPLVARHLYERILSYILKKGINMPKILVVGLGPIGEGVFQVFSENGYSVEGFDIKHGHSDLPAKINSYEPGMIIGATGSSIITKEDLENISLKHTVYLVSASSSDREFPVADYRKGGEGVHDDVVHENLVFVNNGFPFSFMGNRNEMTPEEMEKTMCLLGGSVMAGIVNGISGPGLHDVPKELEDIINS